MEYVWIVYIAFINPDICNEFIDKYPEIEQAIEVQCVAYETGRPVPIRPVLRPKEIEDGK
jgi:hypothetical protein|tara:strand:- start:354 stop:533 length:180 start_codon:yes stop_codon:yes gene_type:complete